MLRFLRLFSAYRLLEQRVSSLEGDVIEADVRARYLQNRVETAETRVREIEDSYSRSLKMLINFQAIHAGSTVVPFPDVHVEMPKPPEEPQLVPINSFSSRLARDVQRERNQEARRKATEAHTKWLAEQADTLNLNAL